MTSDYVYDEVVTLTQQRTGNVSDGVTVGRRIRGDGYPDAVELLHASSRCFEHAVDVCESYQEHELNFTDAVTVAMVREHDIDAVPSFDDDFDGVVDRLNPETLSRS